LTKAARSQHLRVQRTVLDAGGVARAIDDMAEALLEEEPAGDGLMLIGIRTRGLPLAERLAAAIARRSGVTPPIGALDITLYRDDLSTIGPQPVVRGTDLPGPIDGRVVVLCDDVLYTGRTVRAALDELADYGRPRAVRLAVLVDRGHRELPVQPDVVGLRLDTTPEQVVEVAFADVDGSDAVRLLARAGEEEEA